jgi:nicotinate-nucleotide pyrophosphorylase (carboxylating)
MSSQLIAEINACLKHTLAEDVGAGDATTEAIVPEGATLRGQIIAKQDGIIAGVDVAAEVFRLLDAKIHFTPAIAEGGHIEAGGLIGEADGSARSLLTGERTALNLLNRMSGIATLTRKFVDAIAHTQATILDTRKTAPGLRTLDKLAVRRGGGENHRIGLYDMILIKDNHIDFAGSIAEAVRRARAAGTDLEIEVEARTIADVNAALDLGIKKILLDNMNLATMREAVVLNANRAKLEASGNVTLQNVTKIAETGVDYISVGALTHSPASFDSSFKWVA